MDVAMPSALGFIEAVSASEHDVGDAEELGFEQGKLGRSEFEVRQLVHAVVDGACCVQMPGEAEHHRRVVPADKVAVTGQRRVKKTLERCLAGLTLQPFRQKRRGYKHIRLRTPLEVQYRLVAASRYWLLPVDHPLNLG